MKFNSIQLTSSIFITTLIFTCVSSYKIIYEKLYDQSDSCSTNSNWWWQDQQGSVINTCEEYCTLQSDPSTIVRFVGGQKDLKFTYIVSQVDNKISFIGIDIIYFLYNGNQITLKINTDSNSLITNELSYFEENQTIICPQQIKFQKASLKSSSVPTTIELNLNRQKNSEILGVRSIRIWGNCIENCQICENASSCNLCMNGFTNYQMVSGNKVCEQTQGCTIANCFSCYKENGSEICYKCQPGYKSNGNNTCTQISSPICSTNQYADNGICQAYSNSCVYADRQTQKYLECPNNLNTQSFKCKNEQMAIMSAYQNYQIFQCGCTIDKCISCSNSSICSQCEQDYIFDPYLNSCEIECPISEYYNKTTQKCELCNIQACERCSQGSKCYQCLTHYFQYNNKCVDSCPSGYYGDGSTQQCLLCINNCSYCQSSSHCDLCKSGYNYNQTLNICEKKCLSNQYYNSQTDLCTNCSPGCKTCISTQCTQCSSNYVQDPNNLSNCIQCQVLNCQECVPQNQYKCQSCQLGYEVNSQNFTCDLVCSVSNCQNCEKNNLNKCQKCLSNFFLTDSFKCQIVLTNEIYMQSINQKVLDDGYELDVIFSKKVKLGNENLSQFITIKIEDTTDFTFSVQKLTETSIKIVIKSNVNVKYKSIRIDIVDKQFIENNQMQNTYIIQDLLVYVYISQLEREAAKQVASVGKGITTAAVSSMLPIVILSNFYFLVNTIDITGFLYYMLFINIRHPENVLQFYSIFKDFQFPFIPNFFSDIVSPNYTQVSPPKFMEKQTDRYFIKNVGQSLTIWIVIIGFYAAIKILSKIKIKYVQPYLKNSIENTWEYSSFFDMLWNTYVYCLIGCFLQFCEYEFSDHSAKLNYSMHTIVSIICILAPFLVFYLVHREKDIKNNPIFLKKYSTLVSGIKLYNIEKEQQSPPNPPRIEFKLDKRESLSQFNEGQQFFSQQALEQKTAAISQFSLIIGQNLNRQQKLQMKLSKYYNPILYFRKIFFSIVIAYPVDYVYLQLSLLCILYLSIIWFLYYIEPLESRYENIKTLCGESILFCITICAFFLVNDEESQDEKYRLRIGWAIVSLSAFILLWNTSQIVVEALKSIIQLITKIFNAIKQLITKNNNNKVMPINNLETKKQSNEISSCVSPQQEAEKVNSLYKKRKNITRTTINGLFTSQESLQFQSEMQMMHSQKKMQVKGINEEPINKNQHNIAKKIRRDSFHSMINQQTKSFDNGLEENTKRFEQTPSQQLIEKGIITRFLRNGSETTRKRQLSSFNVVKLSAFSQIVAENAENQDNLNEEQNFNQSKYNQQQSPHSIEQS